MRLKLIVTEDGSHSIEGERGLAYHSTFGAIRESRHLFLERGLGAARKGPLRIFEMGLGAGLNALLTLAEAIDSGRRDIREHTLVRGLVHRVNAKFFERGCVQPAMPGYNSSHHPSHPSARSPAATAGCGSCRS